MRQAGSGHKVAKNYCPGRERVRQYSYKTSSPLRLMLIVATSDRKIDLLWTLCLLFSCDPQSMADAFKYTEGFSRGAQRFSPPVDGVRTLQNHCTTPCLST